MTEIRPQDGFQKDFLSTKADIAIGGGAAGAGKTYALLLESLRHVDKKGFGGVIFRRTSPQIKAEGGLWDTTEGLFPLVGGKPKESSLEWYFGKQKIKFSHLEYEKNVNDWQGSQIPFIGFDEVTHFTKKMFFYLLSRNRSVCGVKPYVRATCNPDPDSFIAEFISWWINQETGYAIPERAGKLRYFISHSDTEIWGDTKEEVYSKSRFILDEITRLDNTINPFDLIKSVTFIPGSIYENKKLIGADPSYLGNLLAQSEEEQLRLLKGNWKIKVSKDVIIDYFKFNDCFTNDWVKGGVKYITADIATKGSDLLVMGVWDGLRLIDIELLDKNNGKEAYELIKKIATKHKVSRSNIIFDADGIGGGLTGFLDGCVEFNNGGKPIKSKDKNINYKNAKTQLFFELSYCVNGTNGKTSNDAIYIDPLVAEKIYPYDKPSIYKGKTIKYILQHQIKAIRRSKPDNDGKLQLIQKPEMKAILQGLSPDLLDMIMERMYFEVNKNTNVVLTTKNTFIDIPEKQIENKISIINVPNKNDNNFTMLTFSQIDSNFYLTDVIYKEIEIDKIKNECTLFLNDKKIDYGIFESDIQGKDFYRYLKINTNNTRIKGEFNHIDRYSRMLMQVDFINSNFYFKQNPIIDSDYFNFINDAFYFDKENTTVSNSINALIGAVSFIKRYII